MAICAVTLRAEKSDTACQASLFINFNFRLLTPKKENKAK